MKRLLQTAGIGLLLFALLVGLLPLIPQATAPGVTPEIYAMALRPGCAGVYYKCRLTGDTTQVSAWGVALSTAQMPEADNLDTLCLYTRTEDVTADTGSGALLANVLDPSLSPEVNGENAEITIYGRAYAQLKDGSYVFGEGVAYTLSQLLSAVDRKFEKLTAVQQTAAAQMYERYLAMTHRLDLANLHNTYAEGLALNSYDSAVLDTAIQVLEDASYSGLDLVNRIYVHAFTSGSFLGDNLPEDAPAQLAAGTATETLQRMVVKCDGLNENMLMPGDVLFAGEQLYLYGAGSLRSLNGSGAPKVDTAGVLASVTDFTLLRPAQAMTLLTRTDISDKPEKLTEEQAALIATAKAYWLRGERLQYADTRFMKNGSTLSGEFRWQSTVNAPEDCTSSDWGYTNCAAFTYEVYYQTFGFKLPNNMYTTSNLAKYAATNGTEVYAYNRTAGSTQTEAEKAKVKTEFLNARQPGDILCLRREDNSGHALLYIGNGEILHSSGSTYTYSGSHGVENYEASIRRIRVEDYFFNPEYCPRGDVFTKATKLQVIRPLNVLTNDITENTQNRIKNLEGVVAEKLSSHVRAQTAEKGEQITFTYALHNTKDTPVTLNITETVPAQLEWISGGALDNDTLNWEVTVPAGGRASVSYTAKVKDTVAYGTLIQSTQSYVGGVTVKCEPIRVGKKLTETQQTALVNAFQTLKAEGTELTGLSLVNELYRLATGTENIFADTDFAAVTREGEGCFRFYTTNASKSVYELNPDGGYTKLLAPGLYGGYRLWAATFANDRTRLAKVQDLQIGDVLLGKTSSAEVVMLYLGADMGFINMGTLAADSVSTADRLERLLAYGYYYAIMRPMQALED